MTLRGIVVGCVFLLCASPMTGAQEQGAPAAPAAAPAASAWASDCSSNGRAAAVTCQLSQRVLSSQGRRLLAALTLRFPPSGVANMLITTPVGVALPPGVTFNIDGNAKQTLPFQVCDRAGCYASTAVSPELLAAMQAGQKFNVEMTNTQNQAATVPLSLAGFTAAYNNVK